MITLDTLNRWLTDAPESEHLEPRRLGCVQPSLTQHHTVIASLPRK
jgi:hypothetical protein